MSLFLPLHRRFEAAVSYCCVFRAFLTRTGGLCFKACIITFVLLIQWHTKLAAQQETNYAVHANIIYHFTKYIDWPSERKSGQFIIGVIGESPLFEALKASIAGKMVGEQKIVVKKYPVSSASFDCHILYISDDESRSIKKISGKTSNTSTLLVSESGGLASKGSCINFVIVSDHLKLEINRKNIEDRDLAIASELLKLGKIVK